MMYNKNIVTSQHVNYDSYDDVKWIKGGEGNSFVKKKIDYNQLFLIKTFTLKVTES